MAGPFVSLHGRAFGFNAETGAIERNGAEGGGAGAGDNSLTTASTAANIIPRGTTLLASTVAKDYNLDPMTPGVSKQIYNTANSTLLQTLTLGGAATLRTTAGSTFTKATFNTVGQSLQLTALTTALVALFSNVGLVTFST